MVTAAQVQSFYDVYATLRTISYFTAAGILLAGVLLIARHRIPVRMFAVISAGCAALLTLYVVTGIRVMTSVLQGFAPYGGGFPTEDGVRRAWTGLAGLIAGLVISAAAVLRDPTADPPAFDDEPADAGLDGETESLDAEPAAAEPAADHADGLTVSIISASASSRDVLGDAEERDGTDDFVVEPMFPSLSLSRVRWLAQAPMVVLAVGLACLSSVAGTLIASPVFSNGSTSAADAAPFMVVIGLLTGLVVLLPVWLHEDEIHPVTAVLSLASVAVAVVLQARQTVAYQRAGSPFVLGIGAGATLPVAMYLLGELRAQVARRELLIGAIAALVATATLSVGLAFAFQPDDQLREFQETRQDVDEG